MTSLPETKSLAALETSEAGQTRALALDSGEREMLIGFREAVRRIAAKPIDSSDMMDEIEHLLSLPQNVRVSGAAVSRPLDPLVS